MAAMPCSLQNDLGPFLDGSVWYYNIHGDKFAVLPGLEFGRVVEKTAAGPVCEFSGTTTEIEGEEEGLVAVKMIRQAYLHDPRDTRRVLQDIQLLQFFKHPNVVSLDEVYTTGDQETFTDIYLVTPRFATDLNQILRSRSELTREHQQFILYQILCALHYIHSAAVVHRDLTPHNILLNTDCEVAITDFRYAREEQQEGKKHSLGLMEYPVARWYRCPELLLHAGTYNRAVDIWSVGCIFVEMMTRKPLFCGRDYTHQIQLMLGAVIPPGSDPPDMSWNTNPETREYVNQPGRGPALRDIPQLRDDAVALDLIEGLLTFTPKERLTTSAALHHVYLEELHGLGEEVTAEQPFIFLHQEDEGLRQALWNTVTINLLGTETRGGTVTATLQPNSGVQL